MMWRKLHMVEFCKFGKLRGWSEECIFILNLRYSYICLLRVKIHFLLRCDICVQKICLAHQMQSMHMCFWCHLKSDLVNYTSINTSKKFTRTCRIQLFSPLSPSQTLSTAVSISSLLSLHLSPSLTHLFKFASPCSVLFYFIIYSFHIYLTRIPHGDPKQLHHSSYIHFILITALWGTVGCKGVTGWWSPW